MFPTQTTATLQTTCHWILNEARLSAPEKTLCFTIAADLAETPPVYPTVDLLARQLQYCEKSVRKHLKHLEGLGLIAKVTRFLPDLQKKANTLSLTLPVTSACASEPDPDLDLGPDLVGASLRVRPSAGRHGLQSLTTTPLSSDTPAHGPAHAGTLRTAAVDPSPETHSLQGFAGHRHPSARPEPAFDSAPDLVGASLRVRPSAGRHDLPSLATLSLSSDTSTRVASPAPHQPTEIPPAPSRLPGKVLMLYDTTCIDLPPAGPITSAIEYAVREMVETFPQACYLSWWETYFLQMNDPELIRYLRGTGHILNLAWLLVPENARMILGTP